MKLERSAMMHWINATPTAQTASWFLIGKDVEDMSVELNADIEEKRNILDEDFAIHKGYKPSVDVETYYADPDDAIYPLIRDIALGRKKGDDCKTELLVGIVEDTTAASHTAYKEDVIIEVTSYGGEPGGIAFPYTLHFTGNRQAGTVAIANKVPTFTKASG